MPNPPPRCRRYDTVSTIVLQLGSNDVEQRDTRHVADPSAQTLTNFIRSFDCTRYATATTPPTTSLCGSLCELAGSFSGKTPRRGRIEKCSTRSSVLFVFASIESILYLGRRRRGPFLYPLFEKSSTQAYRRSEIFITVTEDVRFLEKK